MHQENWRDSEELLLIFTCAADLTKPIRQVPICLAAPDTHPNHVQINYTSISGDLSRSSWAGALAPMDGLQAGLGRIRPANTALSILC